MSDDLFSDGPLLEPGPANSRIKVPHHEEATDCNEDGCGPAFRHQMASMCARHTLSRRLPITQWLPVYSLGLFLHDLMAGLTVGLTAIPQGIAYAVVAGLPPQYGLYSGFMGSFVYVFLGSTKDVTVGPTAIMALMTQTYVLNYGADFAVLLTFLSGCIILLFGLLQLGFLVDFISMPVTVGFTSAAALTIGTSQLKGLFGFGGRSDKFMESVINFFEHVKETKLGDTALGFSTIIALLLMQKLREFRVKNNPAGPPVSTMRRVSGFVLWLMSLGRNAIVVFVGVAIAYILDTKGYRPFTLTGHIGEGFPPFGLPPFSTNVTVNNGTETYDFLQMTSKLGSSLIAIPLISILESVAIAKAFCKGKALDATQEMIALGVGNIFGSFVRSIPVTGSFTRTAVNNASGVRTPAGGIFTGLLVMMALGFLTSTFYFIPKATLAGLIITAMIFMVDYEIVPLLWRTKRLDLIPLAATFIFCLLLGLEYGMIVGICVNMFFLLYHAARPALSMNCLKVGGQTVILVTPAESLSFPSAEYLREMVIARCNQVESINQYTLVVIDGVYLHRIDATVAKAVKQMLDDLELLQLRAVLWKWSRPVQETLLGLDPKMERMFNNAATLEMLVSSQENGRRDNLEGVEEDTATSMISGGQHVR